MKKEKGTDMSSPNDPMDYFAEAGKEIIPRVYEDGLQLSTREIGRTLHGVIRTSLRPVNGLVWTINQSFDWVEASVKKRLEARQVPPDRVIEPPHRVLAGVLQGIWASGPEADANLREMYASLLATAMDTETTNLAHPAFTEILRQMLSDEAKIIKLLEQRGGRAIVRLSAESWRYIGTGLPALGQESERFARSIQSLGTESGCLHVEMVPSYVDNLKRLGLIIEREEVYTTHKKDFPPPQLSADRAELKSWVLNYDEPSVAELSNAFQEFQTPRSSSAELHVVLISLTSFGQQFVRACAADG
jgi:hypothetical protein